MTETTPLPGDSYADLIDAPTAVPVDDTAVPIVAAETIPTQARPADTWQCGPLRVTTDPVQVLGARPNRVAAVLDFGTSTVYLAPSQEQCVIGAAAPTSYAVVGHRGEVWAVTEADVVTGFWSAEYVDA